MHMEFLPVTMEEMRARGWDQPDFVYVSGDAYVDHPSFGHAIICRVLEHAGYRVAMLSQPDWHDTADFMRFGQPRLGFMVQRGQYRLHGQSLQCSQAATRQGQLYPRRRARQAPRPRDDSVLQHDTPCVSACADSDRRRGGFAQAVRALRLLGRPRAQFHTGGFGRGYTQLRHGRALHTRGGAGDGGRRAGAPRHTRHMPHDEGYTKGLYRTPQRRSRAQR